MSVQPNALYEADALALLERIDTESISLAYIDLPYGTAAELPLAQHEKNELDEKARYQEFLLMVYQQFHRVLGEAGVLIQHVDRAFSAQVRRLLDDLFGGDNFRREFVIPQHRIGNARNGPGHETILMYSKTDTYTYNPPTRTLTPIEVTERFRYNDESGRYRLANMTTPGERPNLRHPWRGILPPAGQSWRYTLAEMEQLAEDGRIVAGPRGIPRLKAYVKLPVEVAVGDVWNDLPAILTPGERTRYPTQRSLKLLERIVKLATEGNGVVLDPFCGTGTTLVAAASLGRQWIGTDNNSRAISIAMERLNGDGSANSFHAGSNTDLRTHPIVHATYVLPELPNTRRRLMFDEPIDREESRLVEFKEVTSNNPVNTIKSHAERYAVGFLNSAGGRIYWGIRDSDRHVVGVPLTYPERDQVRQVISNQIGSITPSVLSGSYSLEFHDVVGPDGTNMGDLYVVELSILRVVSRGLFYTQSGETYIRVDGATRKLNGLALEQELIRRLTLSGATDSVNESTIE